MQIFFCKRGGGILQVSNLFFWYHPILQLFFTSPQTPFLGLFRRPCLVLYGPFWSCCKNTILALLVHLCLGRSCGLSSIGGHPQIFFFATQFSAKGEVGYPPCRKILQSITLKVPYCVARLGKASKKNQFFLGKSPKLWVGGGQES